MKILPAVSDNFNRVNSSGIVTATQKWQEIIGDWEITTNRLSTATSPASNPIAVIPTRARNVTLQVEQGPAGFGWGVAFWVLDADNWYVAVTDVTVAGGYSCPTNTAIVTLATDVCTYPSSYGATISSYSCPNAGSSVVGVNCTYPSTYGATPSYSCPGGGTSDGAGTCVKTCFNTCYSTCYQTCYQTCGGECIGYAQGTCGCADCSVGNPPNIYNGAYAFADGAVQCAIHVYLGPATICGGPYDPLGFYACCASGTLIDDNQLGSIWGSCYLFHQIVAGVCCGYSQGACNAWAATYPCSPYNCNPYNCNPVNCNPYACNYAATPSYSCPNPGSSVSGSNCVYPVTYGATPNYSCPVNTGVATVSGVNCVYPATYAANLADVYSHVLKLKKSVAGVVTTVATSSPVDTVSTTARGSYVRVVTNGEDVTVTAPLDNAGGTVTLSSTETGAIRGKKHGVALSSVTATAATNLDNFSYSPNP